MIQRLALRVAVAVVACGAVVTAPTVVHTEPTRCLPPSNCKDAKQCCAFKHDKAFRFHMAKARKMRDWFGDACNAGYASGEALNAAADQANANFDGTLSAAFHFTEADAAEVSWYNGNKDLLTGTTNPRTCTSSFPSGIAQSNTCQEFVDAVQEHEGEHADFCGMLQSSSDARSKWGPASGPKAMAESERRAHAWEYMTLVKEYEGARRRCLSAKNQLTRDLDKKSKDSVRKANSSYRHGGKQCG